MSDTELRLILLRHAKSSWKVPGQSDHERPLNRRGKNDAPRIGGELVELGWTPDFVCSSDATRTRQTWNKMRNVLPPVDALFTRRLYLAGLDEIREVVLEAPERAKTILCLGHNPGWESAVAELGGIPEPMATANAALLRSRESDWNTALRGTWELEHMIRPRLA